MFKTISIFSLLVALGTATTNAQQQEAILQNIELRGTGLDIVLAMPKSPAATINLGMSPDALVLTLTGGKLALAFNSANDMMRMAEALRQPACDFQSESKNRTSRTPVAVYVVPNYNAANSSSKISIAAQQPEASMRKVEVPGGEFDIVYTQTKIPVVIDRNDGPKSFSVSLAGTELAMATIGDIERMFKDVGLSQLPICAFDVEHKGSERPRIASVYIIPKGEAPALAAR